MSGQTAEPTHTLSTGRRGWGTLSGPILGLLSVLVLFCLLIGAKGELHKFVTLSNLRVILHEATIPAIIALGVLLIIISGGIDLSVGSVVALVTVVTMQVYRACYRGPDSMTTASLCALLAGVATGGVCGFLNGLMITRLRVIPFVATLGMWGAARGLAVWLSGRRQLEFPAGSVPGWVNALGRAEGGWLGLNPGFLSLLVLALFVALLLRATVFGRHLYAIGSNEATARLCGVNIEKNKTLLYTLAGLLIGWAGVLHFAHGQSGDNSAGEGLELNVIAAVVVGGASLSGGQGTVLGTLLGIAILQLLNNGVSMFNVPVEAQHILVGVIIVANTALSAWQQNRERA